MGTRLRDSIVASAITAVAVSAIFYLSMVRSAGQAGQSARPARIDGKPNFSGIWQANNEAHWDLQAHDALPGPVLQPGIAPHFPKVAAAIVMPLGSAGAVPASLGVVQGDGEIPYIPESLKIKNENRENWIDRDPELKCYLPGTPRAMYMPYPFQIIQGTDKLQIAFAFTNAARVIHLDEVEGPPDDTYMGFSRGRWDGDALVVDVNSFNGKNWFDRAGNHHSEQLKLQERYTLMTPDVINYEVTIEDPKTFTRSWKIAMPIYRRMDQNMQLLEFRCIEFVEEFLYGQQRKQQLVKRWESDTIIVDITRRPRPGETGGAWTAPPRSVSTSSSR